MGVGHVPARPFPEERPSSQLPGREHRGTGTVDTDLSPARVGRLGEAIAGRFLISRGAVVEAHNLRIEDGELDLVVVLDGRRVAVEVKTVLGEAEPLDAFDRHKQEHVIRLAAAAGCSRVDVIGVRVSDAGAEIRWLPAVG